MASNGGRAVWFARALLLIAGLVLTVRASAGPFHWLVSVRSPLTAETAFALVLLASLAIRAGVGARPAGAFVPRAALFAIPVLVVGCFARSLSNYFVSDDFLMLDFCRRWAPTLPLRWFLEQSSTGGAFFRPVVAFTGKLECAWAGEEPLRWHAVDLAFHLVNCALVYFIASTLLANRKKAAWAAALFAVFPSNPEVVSWPGGGRDTLIAATFILATVKLYLSWLQRRGAILLAGSLIACLIALGSKETAFALPLLLAVIAVHQRARLRTVVPYAELSVAMFAYRWYVLRGMGGYGNATILGAAKALALRMWAILLFPVNWSVRPEIYLTIGMAAGLLAYFALTVSRPVRRDLAMAMAWIVLCAAPAVQMLLIGPDLLNSRQIYLPAAGLAMLLAGAIEDLPKLRWAAGAALLVFFSAALEHNLSIRARVSGMARETCIAAAKGAKISDPPRIVDGIWMFGNGFEQCVEMQKRTQ